MAFFATWVVKTIITFATATAITGSICHHHGAFVVALTTTVGSSSSSSSSMWRVLDNSRPQQAWKIIFGARGERGEYMDAYSQQSMLQRCQEDYQWDKNDIDVDFDFALERANMMSHLYDNEQLWDTVCMIAFAEHYVLVDIDEEQEALSKPFETFQRHKKSQAIQNKPPIFCGAVWSDWQANNSSKNDGSVEQKLEAFKNKGIDYVRLECNFGSTVDIGGPTQLADVDHSAHFRQLAKAIKACQNLEMVPLLLLQVPWREEDSNAYFEQAVKCLADALKTARVKSQRLLLETRPPIGMSAQEERDLPGTERISVGLATGQKMFEVIEEAFGRDTIAGFCVAGGSTKGDAPTAMEDDTQNAVRQGMRQCAQRQWGFELCFWEMGAKLMLQPKVGQLWGTDGAHSAGCDAARDLFRVNAEALANEIKAGL